MSRTPSAGRSPPARRAGSPSPRRGSPRRSPTSRSDRRAFRKLAGRLGAIQIDSVNVFVAHPLHAGLLAARALSMAVLEKEAWGRRPSLFEYWGHVASFMPVELQPLFRWRMEAGAQNGRSRRAVRGSPRERRAYIDQVLAEIARRGPVTGGDFAPEGPRKSGWWEWSEGKIALEWLFWAGLITTKTRRGLRARLRPDRAGDPAGDPGGADAEPRRTPSASWCCISARAMGVATVADLADYFRTAAGATPRPRVARAGRGRRAGARCAVKGWREQAYLRRRRQAAAARDRRGAALAVRQPGLAARAHRADVRARATGSGSTRPAAQRDARLLRAAVPAGRADRRAGRPEGRPQGRPAAGAGRAPGAGRGRGGDGGGAGGGTALGGRLAGPRRGGGREKGRPFDRPFTGVRD